VITIKPKKRKGKLKAEILLNKANKEEEEGEEDGTNEK